MDLPDPQYAKTADGAYIAYQVVGDGPIDIAWQLDFMSNLDLAWESPITRTWHTGLASACRLILHDRRATGLSTRNVEPPNLETRASDLRTVLDAADSRQTVLGAFFESLGPCILLAATEPERVSGLVWWHPVPRTLSAPDYPWGSRPKDVEKEIDGLERWGTPAYGNAWAEEFDSIYGVEPPEEERRAVTRLSRNTCTPDVAIELARIWYETDVRGILPAVQAPTLLIVDDEVGYDVAVAEYVASLMPRAEIALVPGGVWPSGEQLRPYVELRLDAVRRFIGLTPPPVGLDSVLATVLFTDIVGSTERAAALGDGAWRGIHERHDEIVRIELDRHRGREIKRTGDGFLATFDGPARGVRCAQAIAEAVRSLGSRSGPACTPGRSNSTPTTSRA